MLYWLRTGLRQTLVLAIEGALCGSFLIRILWCLWFLFQSHCVSPHSSLPSCFQKSFGIGVVVFLFLFFLFVLFSAARVGLMHIGVFILLLLSGERNFGVRLNKPYSVRVPMDIPVFTGTHADLLIIVSMALGVLFFPLLSLVSKPLQTE